MQILQLDRAFIRNLTANSMKPTRTTALALTLALGLLIITGGVLGLVVLGPKRLPEIANKVGGWLGQARRMTRIMRRQLEAELNLDDFNTIQPPKITKQAEPADDAIADHVPSDNDT